MVLPHPYKWNPNPYVGDVQIMALAYWLRHEELREAELKKYKEDEIQSPLWIRVEATNLREVIPSHSILSTDKGIAPI
jgi:hypothetical protein